MATTESQSIWISITAHPDSALYQIHGRTTAGEEMETSIWYIAWNPVLQPRLSDQELMYLVRESISELGGDLTSSCLRPLTKKLVNRIVSILY